MIIEYEGARHEFPDNFSQSDISNALSSYKAPAKPSVGMDVIKQIGSGLITGTEGIAKAPAMLAGLAGRGLNALFPNLGDKEAEAKQAELRNLASGAGGGGISQYLPQPQTTAGQYARTAAEFLPSAAAAPGGVARNLVAGGVAGLGSEAAGQATAGTAYEPYARVAGALATAPFSGIAQRAITPLPMAAARQPAVQALENQGVQLTAGQRTGSRPLQYFEQALGDIPGAGRGATTAAERSGEQFTGAALRLAGENANRATPEVIDNAFNRIGNQFDALSARNVMRADPRMGQDLRAGINDYHGIVSPPNRAPVIENFEAEIGTALARNNGTLPGDVFQSITSRMEAAARGAPHEVADTLRDMRGALNNAMERSIARTNPGDLGAFREVRNQYRNMLVIERAATGAGENAALGLISPSALRNATVAMGRRAYARGQGDFGQLARSGEAIMRPLPQSGTAPRAYAMSLPASIAAIAGGLVAGLPGAVLSGLGAIAAPPIIGRALMSRPAQAYLGNQLIARGAPMSMTNRLIRGGLVYGPSARGLLSLPDEQR